LRDFSEPALLHTLRVRFTRRESYTAVGSILVSVNPYSYHNYEETYGEAIMDMCEHKRNPNDDCDRKKHSLFSDHTRVVTSHRYNLSVAQGQSIRDGGSQSFSRSILSVHPPLQLLPST
jgi:hypothetical protein